MTPCSRETATTSTAAGLGSEPETEEQLFLNFLKKVQFEALALNVVVSKADIDYYLCWGAERWLHRFDPVRARREGDDPQTEEAIEKIRATQNM